MRSLRLVLVLLFVALGAASAVAQPSLVKSRREAGALFQTLASASVSLPSAASTGNLIVVCVQTREASTISSLTDEDANTYTLAASAVHSEDGNVRAWMYYLANAPTAVQTVTVTIDAPFDNAASIAVMEFSGVSPTDALEDSSTGEATGAAGTTVSSGNVTAAEANTLLVGCMASDFADDGWSGPSGWTAITTDVGDTSNGRADYDVVGAGDAAYAPTTTSNNLAVAIAAAFNPSGGPPATPTRRLLLMGVGQ